jgi:two-component system nitrate/nitrite response regulator NarL
LPRAGTALSIDVVRFSDSDVEAALRQVEGVRAFVVGDDPLARGGISLLLTGQIKVSVTGQAALADDWGTSAVSSGAQAVVVDAETLDEPTRERIRASTLPVVVLAGADAQAREALAAGAKGALARDGDAARLSATLRAVTRGLVVLDERFASGWVRERHAEEPLEPLTARELEVLQLLARGLPNKLIAQRLGISDHTAKFHVNAILSKLGAESRTEAVVLAARLGLVVL